MTLLNSNLFYIIKGELQTSMWRIPLKELKRAAELGKSIYVVDIYSNFAASTFPLFEIEKYLEIQDVDVVYIHFEQEDTITLPILICKMLYKFHVNWINLLYDYFCSNDFEKMYSDLSDIRNYANEIFPLTTAMFNCFSIDPYSLKGAIISEHSYKNKFNAGYALATFEKTKPPTLKAIEDTIKPNKSFNWYLQNDLLNVISQGCFLFNAQLLNEYSNKIFTEKVCGVLKQLNVPTLLLGSNISSLESMLGEVVWKELHPLEVLSNKKEYRTDVFNEFSNHTKIEW